MDDKVSTWDNHRKDSVKGMFKMKQTGLTKDLNRSEEVVLVTVALNPDVSGEDMVEELDTSAKVFSHCIDTLLEKEYIDINEEGKCWRVTELGQLALNKFRVNVKFDLIYANKKGEKKEIIDRLEKKKKRFDAAYKLVKKRRQQ